MPMPLSPNQRPLVVVTASQQFPERPYELPPTTRSSGQLTPVNPLPPVTTNRRGAAPIGGSCLVDFAASRSMHAGVHRCRLDGAGVRLRWCSCTRRHGTLWAAAGKVGIGRRPANGGDQHSVDHASSGRGSLQRARGRCRVQACHRQPSSADSQPRCVGRCLGPQRRSLCRRTAGILACARILFGRHSRRPHGWADRGSLRFLM